MNILQSTIERGLYLLLLLLFLINIIGLVVNINILKDHTRSIQLQEQQTKTIENNQLTNSLALKDYIACLLVINPNGNLPNQEHICFINAPEVK